MLKTLLICDLVDSTRLIERMGDKAASELFRLHDQSARQLLREHQGREIDKTDGFLLLFDRPINAVLYALAYHEALRHLSSQLGVFLGSRVGIHLGEVFLRENALEDVARGAKPLEVEGLAKAFAARLMSLADRGQTLLTRSAFELARRSAVGTGLLERQVKWHTYEKYIFQGVAEPVEVFEVGAEGMAPLTAPQGSEKARRMFGGAHRPTILVLPFDNLSPGGEADYLGDGLTDELITELSKVDSLRVISRTSSMHLKGSTKDLRDIGRELSVRYILEGSVTKAGEQLRITAKLVDTHTSNLLWGQKYKGLLEDVFDFQEQISRTIVDALKLTLSAQAHRKLAERPIPNIQAYEYYLKAKQQIFQFTAGALDRSLKYLQAGVDILGDNILLTSAIGYVHWQYINAGISSDRMNLEKAKDCALRVLDLDPDSAHGHRLLGLIYVQEGDVQAVVRHLKRALARAPNDTDALFWLSLVYGFAGYASSGMPLASHLLQIDPLTPFHHILPGFLALMNGEFEQAPGPFWRSHQMDPGNPIVRVTYGQILAINGRLDEAHDCFELLQKEIPDSFFSKLGRVYQCSLRGERELALDRMTSDVREAAWADFQYSWSMAECFALIGEKQQAVDWLANAIRLGFWNYPLLARLDPLLSNIRSEPAFQQLMSDLKTRWDRFDLGMSEVLPEGFPADHLESRGSSVGQELDS